MANKQVSCNHFTTHQDEGEGETRHHVHHRAASCGGMVRDEHHISAGCSTTQQRREHFPHGELPSWYSAKTSSPPRRISIPQQLSSYQITESSQCPYTGAWTGLSSLLTAQPRQRRHIQTRTKPLRLKTLNELSLLMTPKSYEIGKQGRDGRKGQNSGFLSNASPPLTSAIQEIEPVCLLVQIQQQSTYWATLLHKSHF